VTTPVPWLVSFATGCTRRSHLGGKNTLHGQDVDLLGESKRRSDLGTNQIRSKNIGDLVEDASLSGKGSLESHVSGGSLGDEEKLVVRGLEETVLESRSDETVGLTVPVRQRRRPFLLEQDLHGLRSKGGGDHPDLLSANGLLDLARDARSPASHLHLDRSVFLRVNGLSACSVVVHTRLTVLGRVDGVSLSELDLALLVQLVHLPSDERVVVRVRVGCLGSARA
jgi:hypothetical protein